MAAGTGGSSAASGTGTGGSTAGTGGSFTSGLGGNLGSGGTNGGGGPGGRGAGRGGNAGGMFGQGGRTGNGNGFGGHSAACNGAVDLRPQIQRPQVLISLSKNASMKTPFGTSDRLTEVQKALQKAVMAQPTISFGYQESPSVSPCSDPCGCVDQLSLLYPSPMTTPSVLSRLSPCTFSSTSGSFSGSCATTIDSRPIGAALTGAIALFQPSSNAPSSKFVTRYLLLIADGDPSCGNMSGTDLCTAAQGQLSTLGSEKLQINTTFVAVGSDAQNSGCLQRLAYQSATTLISVIDPNQLMPKLGEFMAGAAAGACTVTLSSTTTMDSIDPALIRVLVNNQPVSQNHQNGWDYMTGTVPRIVFNGMSCDLIKKVQHDNEVDISLCPGQ